MQSNTKAGGFIAQDEIGYYITGRVSEEQVIEQALQILESRVFRETALTCPDDTQRYLRAKLGGYEHEVFAVLYLDNRHRVIAFEELFRGTIDGASVHCREVAKGKRSSNPMVFRNPALWLNRGHGDSRATALQSHRPFWPGAGRSVPA